MPSRPQRLFALACLALMLFSAPGGAHESLDEALAHVDLALAAAPRDAGLWLRRASLQRDRGALEIARADLARACALGLAPAAAERERGLLARAGGRLAEAEPHLRRARELAPQDVGTLRAHAEVLARLDRPGEAADATARAIALTPRPGPALFLALVRAHAAAGDTSAALRALADAEARLGPIPALTQEGIALELRAGRTDAALARLARASASSSRRESGLLQRAQILERAGRSQEAASAYAAALRSIETLPPARRATPAATQLAARAREGLERTAAPERDDARRLARAPEADAR